jgi:hypothetical protein
MLTVDFESKWRANVRGVGAWQLCKEAGRRKPAWSNASKSWVVSADTAREVVELAQRIDGLNVVVTGPRSTRSSHDHVDRGGLLDDLAGPPVEEPTLWG